MNKQFRVQIWKTLVNYHLESSSISQREFSRRIGVEIGTLTNYLNGKVDPLNIRLCISNNIAVELGMPLEKYYKTIEYGPSTDSHTSINQITFWARNHASLHELCALISIFSEAIKIDLAKRLREAKNN